MITLWNGCSPVHLLHTSDAFQPLTIITKRSILNVAAVLDPPLVFCDGKSSEVQQKFVMMTLQFADLSYM